VSLEGSSFRLLVGVVIILALAVVVGLLVPPKRWSGIRQEGERLTITGAYRSLDACRSDVEKIGGSCGENCVDYGNGSIANCNPLVSVPKK
jgi:hypothetical protein